jgi:hypothetical protein
MKYKIFLLATIAFACSFITKPFAYNFITVDPLTGGDGTKPEKITAIFQKPKGKVTSNSYLISGTKSAVRLKIKEAIFNAYPDKSSSTLDPSLYIMLYKVAVGKTDRSLTMNADGSSAMYIPVTITKPDGYTIRISPSVAMLPGEYAFVDKTTTTTDGNVIVWTFGID